jgi:hypothetical protein
VKRITIFILLIGLLLCHTGCELFSEKQIIDEGKNIRFVFEEGLHEDERFKLPKDVNGYYYMTLTKPGQNIQRISVRLLDGDKVVYSKCCGRRHGIRWSSNLFWWILEGDKVTSYLQSEEFY